MRPLHGMNDQRSDMPQYVYLWLRFGVNPGRAFVVPSHRMEQVVAHLRIVVHTNPEFRWHQFESLERALDAVGYAVKVGGGQWAGPCGLLFCATDSHGVCFRANVDASEWLWDPFAHERRALFAV